MGLTGDALGLTQESLVDLGRFIIVQLSRVDKASDLDWCLAEVKGPYIVQDAESGVSVWWYMNCGKTHMESGSLHKKKRKNLYQ